MWNLEFKDQLCPQGRTNRVGKQEAAGAARPRIKGSGGGQRGWVQACRPSGSGSSAPIPSPGGDVCPPLSAVPVQPGERRDGSKRHQLARDGWDSSPPPSPCIPGRLLCPYPVLLLQRQQIVSPHQHPVASFIPAGQHASLQVLPDLPKPCLNGPCGDRAWPGQSGEGSVAPRLRFWGPLTFQNRF